MAPKLCGMCWHKDTGWKWGRGMRTVRLNGMIHINLEMAH